MAHVMSTAICTITDGQFHAFQRFPGRKPVFKTAESRFATLKCFANSSAYIQTKFQRVSMHEESLCEQGLDKETSQL